MKKMERLQRLLRQNEEAGGLANFKGKKAPPFKKNEERMIFKKSDYFTAELRQDQVADPAGSRAVVAVKINMLKDVGFSGSIDKAAKRVAEVLGKFDSIIEGEVI